MAADTKRETLLKAISDLGTYGGGKSWRVGGDAEYRDSWSKAVQAILALSPERARRLTAAEVAVLFRRSEKQTNRVLVGPPPEGTFQAEHKNPRHFRKAAIPTPSFDGKMVERLRWVYVRDDVQVWWERRRGKGDASAEAKRVKARIARLLKQRKDLENIQRKASQSVAAIDEELATLRLFVANGTMKAITHEPQPWVVNSEGHVHDQAWLPVSSVADLTHQLERGDIRWLSLSDALGEYTWAEGETRMAWSDVWHAVVAREYEKINAGLALVRKRESEVVDTSHMKKKDRKKT